MLKLLLQSSKYITWQWSISGRTDSSMRWNIISTWSKEELPDLWKEFITVPIYMKGDKIGSSYYHGIPMLSISYKILSNILRETHQLFIDFKKASD
jgi:hypothetical protein